MNPTKFIKDNYLLIIIILIGAILRFYKLDFQSAWLDEIHTLNESNPNLTFLDVYQNIMTAEQMPPLYFYTLYILFKAFGYTVLIARTYSALIGLASLFAIYKLGELLENKKTGLIASLLLSINFFHVFYSQEARPYGLLLFFTITSFYYLVKFIKKPNRLDAIYFGITAGLMIISHFFGLFVLLAQCFLLGLFLLLSEKKNRVTFFINSCISGLVIILLFIPAIQIFLKVSDIKTFWIPPTDINSILQIFKDFCGNSGYVMILAGGALLYYFILLFANKSTKNEAKETPINNRWFGFIILISWIVVVLAIPIIRSYLVVPMIISRYFIVILPPLLVLISIAISNCRPSIVRASFVLLFVAATLYEYVYFTNYYKATSKAQFREVTQFVIENDTKNDPIVSSLAWYLPYFLKNNEVNFKITEQPLDDYIADMQKDSTKIKSFWYLDAFDREYKPNASTTTFINSNFYIENSYTGFQAWTKHFVLAKEMPKTIDISKYKPINQKNGDSFAYSIESYAYNNKQLSLSGWAYFEKQAATKTAISLVLIKDGIANRLQYEKVTRPDVTTYFKSDFDISNSGFTVSTDLTSFPDGEYQLGIYLINTGTKRDGLVLTDKRIIIKQ
ncbi:MAG: hypothetical protein RL699_578 [Bacteroidota bacterium]|jgi:uncharacterized membrane protein